MEQGYLGEFNVYQFSQNCFLLVDPSDEFSGNLEIFKKQHPEFEKYKFRGLKGVILKEGDELNPVPIDGTNEFLEGLYLKTDRQKTD